MVKKGVVFMLVCFLLVGSSALANTNVELKNHPLKADKEILNYLLWTVDEKLEKDVIALQEDLSLSREQMDQLKDLGLAERLGVMEKSTELKNETNVSVYNAEISAIFQARNVALQEVLGEKYEEFEKWIEVWWEAEREYRANWLKERVSLNADIDRVSGIFATQYDPNTSGAYELALPDRYLKFANLGWTNDIPQQYRSIYNNAPYVVNIYNPNNNRAANGVPVDEVGPWNTHDNYWNSSSTSSNNPRRSFTDLDLGTPQAYAAFFDDHNDGRDEGGRVITNAAGIDLTPGVATDIGLGHRENAWIDVRYEFLP